MGNPLWQSSRSLAGGCATQCGHRRGRSRAAGADPLVPRVKGKPPRRRAPAPPVGTVRGGRNSEAAGAHGPSSLPSASQPAIIPHRVEGRASSPGPAAAGGTGERRSAHP